MTKLICLIPLFNKEKTLAKAIESVIMQKTNFDYKLLILDDCSTDNSNSIATQYQQKYPNQINIIRNVKNQKLMRNIANGYKQLKGADYFCVLDPDDWYIYDKKFLEAVEYLDNNQDYSMYMTNILFKKNDKENPWYKGPLKSLDFSYNDRKKGKGIFIQTSGVVYRNLYFKTGENKDFNKILDYRFPESCNGDGFRYEWHLKNAKAHFENKITAVYNYDKNGVWSQLTKCEQDLENAKLMYSCSEFIKDEKEFYLIHAKKLCQRALKGFKKSQESIFAKNKDEILDLELLLFDQKFEYYKGAKIKNKYKIFLFFYKKLQGILSKKGLI